MIASTICRPGVRRDDSGFCFSDSTVKQPKGCSPTRRPGEGQDPYPQEFVVTPSWGIHPCSTIDSGGNGSRVKPGTTVVLVLPIQLSNSREDTRPHCRGAMRPSFGLRFTLLSVEGAGKAGCALHPRSRVQNCAKKRTRAYRFSGNTPAFPARWVTAYFELSPVTGLFCHRRLADTSAKLDASIGAPGPHDFTVRNSAVRRARDLRAGAAPSTASRPAFVTTRDPPLVRVRWGELVQLICPTV